MFNEKMLKKLGCLFLTACMAVTTFVGCFETPSQSSTGDGFSDSSSSLEQSSSADTSSEYSSSETDSSILDSSVDSSLDSSVEDNEVEFFYKDYSKVDTEDFNKGLYFINKGGVDIADPTMIYITDEDSTEYGYFYAYGTSYGNAFRCLRSKNLTDWENMGVAFAPDHTNSWSYRHYWAPEIIYDQGKYYLLYSARWYQGEKDDVLYMSVAVADEPYGPFKEPTHVNLDGRQLSPSEPVYKDFRYLPGRGDQSNAVLDIQPFIDPVTGDRYIYFSAAFQGGTMPRGYQEIYGCKMKDWFTPDYSTVKQLTSVFCTTVQDNFSEMQKGVINFKKSDIQEGQDENVGINEGPFMYYSDGTYYLTFSVYGYTEWQYQVRQAISDAPLGDFVKIQPNKGGVVIASEGNWQGHVMSAGHHSFFTVGDELFIAYHTYVNRTDTSKGRMLAVDKIVMNEVDGKKLLHANGPSYSYQPLPEAVSGYKNCAPLAKISVKENGVQVKEPSMLNNGIIKTHPDTQEQELISLKEDTEIVLDYGNTFINARSIMVYNGSSYFMNFDKISSISLQYYAGEGKTKTVTVHDVGFDRAWSSNFDKVVAYPLCASIIEFAELPINKVTIRFEESGAFNVAEIYVLGKETDTPVPVTEFAPYSYEKQPSINPSQPFTGTVFGSVNNKNTTIGWGRLQYDDGTKDAYIENNLPGSQTAYVKGINGTTFYFETEITVTCEKPYRMTDGSPEYLPKFGIMLGRTFFYIDGAYNDSRGFYGDEIGIVTDYDWANRIRTDNTSGYTNGAYTKLAVARIGKTFYFYVNDVLMATRSDLPEYGENDPAIVQITTWNLGIRLRNYSYTVDSAEVQEKINALA